MPQVSFIIPVGEVGPFTEAAIQSAANDLFFDKDIIVVDNTAHDNSLRDLIANIHSSCPIHYTKCSKRGVAHALNAGIAETKSHYIARLDADDLNMPQRLTVQVKFLEENPDVFAVGSYANLIDISGKKIGNLKTTKIRNIEEMRKTLQIENPFIHPTMTIRRSVFENIKYSSWAKNCQDWDLWLNMCKMGFFARNIEKNLISYRIHENQQSKDYSQESIHCLSKMFIYSANRPKEIYLYQRNFLEKNRPSIGQIKKIMQLDYRNISNLYSLRKFIKSLISSIIRYNP